MKIFIISANRRCDSNSIDVSVIINYLKKNNIEILNSISDADTVIISTCGSITETKEYSEKILNSIIKKHKNKKIIFFGCLPRIAPELCKKINEKNNNIIIIKELSDLNKLISLPINISEIKERVFDDSIYSLIKNDPVRGYKTAYFIIKLLLKLKLNDKTAKKLKAILHKDRINILIGNGCAGKCSYCLIKLSRKNPVSRREEDIIKDIEFFKKSNKIINLTGDDCASWGKEKGKDLTDLLKILFNKFPEVEFELRYINPERIFERREEYLKTFSNRNIHSINICIQSGSNRILKSMSRNYRIEDVIEFIKELKKRNPSLILRTHIITGYKDEKISDFIDTLKVIKYFDLVNTFLYSPGNYERDFGSLLKGNIEKTIITVYNIIKLVFP